MQLSHWPVPVTKLLWAGPVLAQPSWLGWVQPVPKIQEEGFVGPVLAHFVYGPVLGPTHML